MDTLTKQVRLAAATGDFSYIDAYFEEANVTRSREKALEDLAALDDSSDAIQALQEALLASVNLMQTKYYSMLLVAESIGTDPSTWPTELQDAKLSIRGANELQTLAKTYNQLYDENEERQMLIKHQAEHDPLTDLLNRGSFDRIHLQRMQISLRSEDQPHRTLPVKTGQTIPAGQIRPAAVKFFPL